LIDAAHPGELLLQLARIRACPDQPANVIEHDFRVRECAGKVRDLVELRMKNHSISLEVKVLHPA
jgi:hypothetical protein